MSGQETNSAQSLVEPLTRRESEILVLLDQGFSAPEIAEQLTLAVSSIKWHIQHVYGKLGVSGKRQALTRAKELGLLGTVPLAAAAEGQPSARPERKHNLPLQVTRFFGREREIAQLKERLAEQRLVTLTGSGGVGKTRLALRTAEDVLRDFSAGVWLVELAPLSDPALVAQQVASNLGVHDESGRPILETLTFFLRDRQLLLVLDNCEHLLEACGRLADTLLRACPRLRILASSREPLGIAGEAVFAVPSLSFPDPDHLPPIDTFNDFVAVSLLLDRARLVLPDYHVAAHNAAPLARICQRLDGIPLAIEMAAARLNILSAGQLADRLDDAFRLLTGGTRTALPRQQTLRATVDWSYKLLSDKERLLFQRLSVFAGGCTLEAAEAICAAELAPLGRSGAGGKRGSGARQEKNVSPAPPPPSTAAIFSEADVLDLLASLVAKSMVIADRRPGEETRYHILELVRQYAREKLQDFGESVALHARHRDYFLALAETNIQNRSKEQERGLQTERENLRLALEWSFNVLANVEAGPRLVIALPSFWTNLQEHFDWCKRGVALCQSRPEISTRLHASLLLRAAYAGWLNDPQSALTWSKQAVEISRRLGPDGQETLIVSLEALGRTYMVLDAVDQVLAPYAEAEALLQELGPDHYPPEQYLMHVASYSVVKAMLANMQGQYQAAKVHASEGLRLFEEHDRRGGIVEARIEFGLACLDLGEYEQARGHFLQVLHLTDEWSTDWARIKNAFAIWSLGIIDVRQGKLDQALEYCRESLRLANQIPDRNIMAGCFGLGASIAAKQDQPMRAARLSGATQALFAKQGRKPWEDSSLDTLLPGWRERPDQAAILKAFEAGKAMDPEQMVAYALGDADS